MHKNDYYVVAAIDKCADLIINALTVFISYILVLPFYEPVVSLNSPEVLVCILIFLILSAFIYEICDIHGAVHRFGTGRYLRSIFKSNFILFGLTLLVSLLFAEGDVNDFVLIWCIIAAVLSTSFLIFKTKAVSAVIRALRKRDYHVRRVIIVGDNVDSANAFAKQVLESSDGGMVILGGVGRKMNSNVLCDYLGTFEELDKILDSYKPSDVVFAIDAYNKKSIISLVNKCDDRCIKVYFLPVMYGFFKSPRQIENIGNVPIINAHGTPLDNGFNAFSKRVVDIVGSGILILLSLPIMLGIAVGVKLTSPGPILFRQDRVGKMGKRFKMLKFRSMYVTKDANHTWTTHEDERKTRFGAFLRRSSLDELPQLFNVFKGEMSLVGPRPEVPHFVEYFKNVIPLYMVKHYVKPGMTGLAQIKGLRGDTSVEDRIQADISYIENWSFMMDLMILLKTPFKAFNSSEKYVHSEIKDETDADIEFDFSTMKARALPSAKECPISDIWDGKPKKILYAASTMSHIGNFHTDYIKALRDMGHTVLVMAGGEGADFDIPFEKRFISFKNLINRYKIRKILKKECFDTLILNTSLAAYHIRMACHTKRRPRIVNFVHGYLFSENVSRPKAFAMYACERLLARKTDEIIVMNLQDYRTAIRKNLCRNKVYFVKGMGAVVREIMSAPEEIRRQYGCEDKYVLSFIGELSERKNQEFLIRAMVKLREILPEAVLWLIGGGADRERLETVRDECGLSDAVYFMGARADACDFMRASDLCVSASSIEGMPFNIIEALGCGTTVLASDIKGHVDIIENGVDGYLYSYNNVEDFITKVYKINKKAVSVKMDKKIAKYEKYTKDRVFPDTLSVLIRTI